MLSPWFTMLLAKHAGIEVPGIELRQYGEVRALVIERFDRKLLAEQHRVLRRHVIDGCQATNLPPTYKYERQHGDEGDGIYIRDGVSFQKLFNVETTNPEAYQTQLIRWMTFNILVSNYDAHGKNISFFVGKHGLSLTPFYDLVNIEAIIREIKSRQSENNLQVPLANHFAMSIGDYTSGSAGNFDHPFTAYMLADFANEFGVSLARLQLLMKHMVKHVLAAIKVARKEALTHRLTESEIEHIDVCIQIINDTADVLTQEVEQIPVMAELF